MSTKVDNILRLAKVLEKKAQEAELLIEEDIFPMEKSVPIEEDFNIESSKINEDIKDFIEDMLNSGVSKDVLMNEINDVVSRWEEPEGEWENDNLVASKKVENLLKMAGSLKKR